MSKLDINHDGLAPAKAMDRPKPVKPSTLCQGDWYIQSSSLCLQGVETDSGPPKPKGALEGFWVLSDFKGVLAHQPTSQLKWKDLSSLRVCLQLSHARELLGDQVKTQTDA